MLLSGCCKNTRGEDNYMIATVMHCDNFLRGMKNGNENNNTYLALDTLTSLSFSPIKATNAKEGLP